MIFIRHCEFHIHELCKKDWWIEGIYEDCLYEYELFKKNLAELEERYKQHGNNC